MKRAERPNPSYANKASFRKVTVTLPQGMYERLIRQRDSPLGAASHGTRREKCQKESIGFRGEEAGCSVAQAVDHTGDVRAVLSANDGLT
jgi:hypothetical protein